MSLELLLALDLGTTGVRALLVTPEGRVPARAYRPLSTAYPQPSWVEQDPEEMWQRSVEVMREALRSAGVEADHVAAIGVVTQRSTVIAWDGETGEPLQSGPASSAWWQWTAPASGTVTVDTFGSSYNTYLTVWTGSAVDALTETARNDNAPSGGVQSKPGPRIWRYTESGSSPGLPRTA